MFQGCFLESVDKATLCCPLCRKRVSTWARQNSRNKTLVNQQLWDQIQDQFPLHCQQRLSGQDGGVEDDLGGTKYPQNLQKSPWREASVSVCGP